MMISARLRFLAFVLLCKIESALSSMWFKRSNLRMSLQPSFIMDGCFSRMALLNHPHRHGPAANAFVCKSHPLQAEGEVNDISSDPDEPSTGNSLRCSIQHLVSIIDPKINPHTDHLSVPSQSKSPTHRHSIVHIIGTGVTPSLVNLPLSTLFILSQADVVLYDALGLSHDDIRRIIPNDCEIICVGKRGDKNASWKQVDIDELLLQKATESALLLSGEDRQGTPKRTVNIVRLKGGDPFLFGRTRSEIEVLRANNIPYTYTPGISSCIAGPHLGGIPLTDGSLGCQSFGVWSGTDALGKSWGVEDDDTSRSKFWQDMDVDVLVFLMIGRLDKLEALCQSLANNCFNSSDSDNPGRWNKDTPCAVIQNAGGLKGTINELTSLPVQRVWRSSLGNIVANIRKEDTNRTSVSPAIFVVGATAALDLLSQ